MLGRNYLGKEGTVRTLALIGLALNGIILFSLLLLSLFWQPLLVYATFGILLGWILPILGYKQINPRGKNAAGIILIFSGIISIAISFTGGILLIVAGALAISWKPDKKILHQPYSSNSRWQHRQVHPSMTTTGISKKCVNCGTNLERYDQFCWNCGTQVDWY
jgi:hypothetical protein